ncbi:uncharacterized protein LOC117642189 [Thrips palmi]|uniref:Uncharacterized protein LOC117642189 n=1 Tax=Thrips palmi TaxID=161013 RepID=A0A6P8YHF7_THRPL|nr:uncharacterized protein LOC117642189 [Thrips palmi]
MARSLLALLACLALAAPCLTSVVDNDVSNDISKDVVEKVPSEAAPLVFLVDDDAPAVDNALLKQKESALGWGYTTPRYPTPRYPTSRRPSTSRRPWPTIRGGWDQSFNIGGVYPYDRQLSQTPVYKRATAYVNSLDFKYTDPARRAIHCIQVVDMQKNGRNAAVTLQSGGIGQSYFNMRFQSQRGENINYLVIVWGQ